MRRAALAAVCWLAAAQQTSTLFISGEDAGYVDSGSCAACHPAIAASYRQTGMARSFYAMKPGTAVEDFRTRNRFYHKPSDRHYLLYERDGRFFQRRYQVDPAGREYNIVEKEIHYVLGSGNHARTYLHRSEAGHLLQLPIGWYAERGGYWAMNPGYDRPDHMDFRRMLDRECFFCHNAYPRVAPDEIPGERALVLAGEVPQGIDCQRCHGPGRQHVQLAQTSAPRERVRQAIVNPAKLNAERSLEVCLQCHLQSTSHRLPYAIRRYGRSYFSYRPGEPLGEYITHFERPQPSFEIAHSAYRLMQSACFRKSNGRLLCTTCHDPHKAAHGQEDATRYEQVCRSCHTRGQHVQQRGCLDCHMPKRRTDDVVHVVMTDHRLARRSDAGDLLAERQEVHDTDNNSYRGEVALLYPRTGADPIYLDLAQVIEGANMPGGIPRLERSIGKLRPQNGDFYFEMGLAWLRAGQAAKSITWFEQGLQRQPAAIYPRLFHATALTTLGRTADAIRLLESTPSADAAILNMLGATYLAANRVPEAIATLQRAEKLDRDLPEIYVNLGVALARAGNKGAAIEALRTAIRLAPDLAAARKNLELLQR